MPYLLLSLKEASRRHDSGVFHSKGGASCLFDGLNTGRPRDRVEPDLRRVKRHLHYQEYVAVCVRAEMPVQVLLASPPLLEHEDVIFLYILRDITTETATVDPALLSSRSEDFQCLITLLLGYRHPYGRENHVVIPLRGLTKGSCPLKGMDLSIRSRH